LTGPITKPHAATSDVSSLLRKAEMRSNQSASPSHISAMYGLPFPSRAGCELTSSVTDDRPHILL